MNNVCLGILAHVDAGKTTLSEAMLYKSGKIKNLGRVDHKDSFLDTYRLERERGITIFSKQAVFNIGDLEVNLLDTPGHMDFSSEMERVLSVLDYAILVISGSEGVQAHTSTLWGLLRRYRIPTFIWVNKMDLASKSKTEILADLNVHLGGNLIDFTSDFYESASMTDESALEEYLDSGVLSTRTLQALIRSRRLFPCWFGSSLKMDGLDEFIHGLETYMLPFSARGEFGAKVYKITRDVQGNRLTWVKVSGGELKVRTLVGEEKITQIRRYSGDKFETADILYPGQVGAICGLEKSFAGQGLGSEADAPSASIEPVLSYGIHPTDGSDIQEAYRKLCQLAEEDPQLNIVWNPGTREIQARLMGAVQIEILKDMIADRFGMDVSIDTGKIMYKETIASPVEGCGHFEPLRHYAEVHLLLEPLAQGSGIVFESACSTDTLDLNWQRLILTNLAEKQHLGVLTGSPITDIKFTLVAGRAHLKHTEGGDFRQAVYRAVRQGLMKAENVLLEPFYDFSLEVPSESIGRAISDVKAMGAVFEGPESLGENSVITGKAPASEMQDYQVSLLSYTKGRGRLSCRYAGYYPCHNTAKVIEAIGYDPDADVENTADSVFCSHGAGVNVKWNVADSFMHIDSGLQISKEETWLSQPKVRSGHIDFDEAELDVIMQKEFGKAKRPEYSSVSYDFGPARKAFQDSAKKDYLIVDGYNMLFGWESLSSIAKTDVAAARTKLTDILANFRAFKGCELVLVFDGYKLKDNPGSKDEESGVKIVYTPQGLSADAYIESLAHEMGKNYRVKIVTSDGLIQIAALRNGLVRMSARELETEVLRAREDMENILSDYAPSAISLEEAAKFRKM